MKKCYIIGGLGCSGKTTFAEKLSRELNCRWFKCDDVYFDVGEKLNRTDLINLPMIKTWELDNEVEKVVIETYKELFGDMNDETLILESGSLYWNSKELEVVKNLLPDYTFRYLCLMPDYEQWLKNRSHRLQTQFPCPDFLDQNNYYSLCLEYQTKYLPKHTIIIRDILSTDCSLTGGTNYQSDEFSNPKWGVFNFPLDMTHKSFLDISCNTGVFSKKAFDCGAEVSGIDISWQVLDKALDLIPQSHFALCSVEKFIKNIPMVKIFDYVLSSSAFHYYTNREEIIESISKITDYFILETPVLESDKEEIIYQSDFKPNFCALVSEPLLLKWLKKYFKNVEKIGYTKQPNSSDRPVFRCTN